MPATEPIGPDPKNTLLRLAGALAEAAPVDWDAERKASPDQARELTNLQRLESLRMLFSRSGSSDEHAKPAANDAELPMPSLWGHLEIVRRIGIGAFAEVYLAYDPQLDTRVALKLLRVERIATEKERFLKEARRLARVQHPNVVTVHGVAEHSGRPGFWMDYLQGPNLEKRLHEQGRLAWHAATMIGVEMCEALSSIHAAGLVHGDVKAANVVWCENAGKHVLMDLGAAAEAHPSGVHLSSTCGTPVVMAPEVYLRRAQPSPASDVYSLGVMLYRLVSGSYPVEAKNELDLHRKLADKHFAPVSLRDRRADLPLRFVRVVERALDRVSTRYASAGDFERALLDAVDPIQDLVPVAWWLGVWRRLVLRPLWEKAVGAVVLLILAALLAMPSIIPFRMNILCIRHTDGVAQPVVSGASVRPGDVLSMKFESSHNAYVYVFNETEKKLGRLNTLFPVSFSELQNPLERNSSHILPGNANGTRIRWPVDDTGGKERILVVASREPLPRLEERIRAGAKEPTRTLQHADDPTRSITIEPPPLTVSQIDLIVRDLGKPNRQVQWNVIELESKTQP